MYNSSFLNGYNLTIYRAPLGINYLGGKRTSHYILEFGADFYAAKYYDAPMNLTTRQNGLNPYFAMGYRYQTKQNGLFGQLLFGSTYFHNSYDKFSGSFNMGIGYSFW